MITATVEPNKCVTMMMRGWEKGEAGAVKIVVTTAANDAMRIV
jgi:hypothetical protein